MRWAISIYPILEKIGDLLFCLPTAKALAKKHNLPVDFYTSQYCQPVLSLLEYQGFISRAIVPPSYKIEGYYRGIQPWQMPVTEEYEHIYHLGFSDWPVTNMIDYYAQIVDIVPEQYQIDCPYYPDETIVDRSILKDRPLALCVTTPIPLSWFEQIIHAVHGKVPIIQLGESNGEIRWWAENKKMPGFLDTASIFKHCRAFFGSRGANTVLSIAFSEMQSIIVLPKNGMDHRHNVHRDGVAYYFDDQPIHRFIEAVIQAL